MLSLLLSTKDVGANVQGSALGWLRDLVRVGSLSGFALGGQIQSQCGLNCLGNHKHSIVWFCLL